MNNVVGIDEVGRGAWAGPLVVGAVQLSKEINGLTDSKLIKPHIRENLARLIYEECDQWGLGWVSSEEVDELGLSASIRLATEQALKDFPDDVRIIIDGQINFLTGRKNVHTLVKADSLVPAVSAASIIAKVVRDEYMRNQSKTYNHYGFETNVGYGTTFHSQALKKHGACQIHRRSYKPIAAFIAQKSL